MRIINAFSELECSDSNFFFFFFQAEDGIRDIGVTGVQTCALPISPPTNRPYPALSSTKDTPPAPATTSGTTPTKIKSSVLGCTSRAPTPEREVQIGRASCRERV